jgi:hypothetical protein
VREQVRQRQNEVAGAAAKLNYVQGLTAAAAAAASAAAGVGVVLMCGLLSQLPEE